MITHNETDVIFHVLHSATDSNGNDIFIHATWRIDEGIVTYLVEYALIVVEYVDYFAAVKHFKNLVRFSS